VGERAQARRYWVSGSVQGVGYRYFAVRAAQRLGVAGFVRNLSDGRVEVYAVGEARDLEDLRQALERGPSAAWVSGVAEEPADVLPRYSDGFSIETE